MRSHSFTVVAISPNLRAAAMPSGVIEKSEKTKRPSRSIPSEEPLSRIISTTDLMFLLTLTTTPSLSRTSSTASVISIGTVTLEGESSFAKVVASFLPSM